ncbi:Do family serine endopeptidase [Corallincola holothuriorum]|uniref:Do family serine endopeptidase n=1 Tax=Corallincola holothuriorum TaxID=2282215 RepID=A0A368NJ14_9GAMM|nr:Do family serine endopeptidase [Corallincola holothuriorum]RCU49863.1 Do family serine endopeptidase [Corallincola holothuriorum]
MKRLLSLASLALCATLIVTPTEAAASLPLSVEGQPVPSLAPMLEKVTPAVVDISVSGTHTAKQRVPDIYQYFFGAPREQVQERPFRGLGSGVIIDSDKGYIVTNHHVIDSADKIMVTLQDGRELDARVIGSDEESDIALLQVDQDNLVALPRANASQLRVGDFVVAVGNPFGLGQTATSGIISALGRSNLNIGQYENFIQTDAAINSGNSGGALVNLNGELVGINTAIVAPNGGNVGIGFAIPIDMVNDLVSQFIEFGEVRRGVLGVSGGELTPDLAEAFGYDTKHGAFVNQVFEGSAAEAAGIKAGDIVVSVDGSMIKSFGELRAKIATRGAGSQVTLGVIRDGKLTDFKVTLKEAEEARVQAQALHPAFEGAVLRNSEDSDKQPGVIVEKVAPRSPASQIGFKEGDIILGLNKQPVTNLKGLRQILEQQPSVLALNIQRNGQRMYLVVR